MDSAAAEGWDGAEAEIVQYVEGVPSYDPARIETTDAAVRFRLPGRLRSGPSVSPAAGGTRHP